MILKPKRIIFLCPTTLQIKSDQMSYVFILQAITPWAWIAKFQLLEWLKCGNKIQWANMIIFKKDYMSFCPIVFFSYEWILEQWFLQFSIINVYSCPSKWHVFLINMKNRKFSVLFIKIIKNSKHNKIK